MKRVILTSAILLLSACSAGPDYQKPAQSVSDNWYGGDESYSAQDPVNLQWWTLFQDPLLEKYIETAVAENNNLKAALANVRAARALRGIESSAFYPQINASGSADRSKSSAALSSFTSGTIRETYDAGFDASWEIDVFGGTRRAVEAADARIGVAQENYNDVLLSVLSEVARNYYEARGLQKQIAITEKNSQLLKETYDLIDALLEAGEATEFDVSRARGEYQITRALVPNLQADLNASVYTLSVLTGQPPEALLDEMKSVKPLPAPPDIVPTGLRSDILRRRPDIRTAERELAAAVADIGVETAELYPKFFITGDAGLRALSFGDLFTSGAQAWSFAGLIEWPVFRGGEIKKQIEAAKARSEGVFANYEQTVLEALADTETALTRYGNELETRRRLESGVQSRVQARSLSRELFDAGEEDYLAVLDAERELIAAENNLVQSETRSITKLITLYTALGGGWQIYNAPPESQDN